MQHRPNKSIRRTEKKKPENLEKKYEKYGIWKKNRKKFETYEPFGNLGNIRFIEIFMQFYYIEKF